MRQVLQSLAMIVGGDLGHPVEEWLTGLHREVVAAGLHAEGAGHATAAGREVDHFDPGDLPQ